MYEHVGLHAADLDASVRFYEATLAPLGFALCTRYEGGAGFGAPGDPRFWLMAAGAGASARAHVCFAARTRADVDHFHVAGLAAGGADNGAPGVRADYDANYYAAFLIDPDGNNIEALCPR
jgi:catechol 2,3-dioxygenase-like lactoylglutathione lyase family enzyme